MENNTPSSLGYSMPAEWHAHEGTWLSWPKNELTFPKSMLPQVEETFCQMIEAIARGEKAKILVDDEAMQERVGKKLEKAGINLSSVVFHKLKSADVWIRDYSPIFAINKKSGKKAAIKFIYNAYGSKYDDLLYDNKTGEEIARASGFPTFHPNFVMEGGSLDANGAGFLLTTKQCLLNKNRNPSLTQNEIEKYLADYLDAKNIIWLESGIEGDDTDGHVDDFARFVSAKAAVCSSEESQNDKNHKPLSDAKKALQNDFEVISLPMPPPLVDKEENRRLPASHANFYISNKAVLMPAFGGKSDKEAKEILESCFAGREVVLINSKELVFGYGGIHCATQQEPKG